MEGKEIGSAKQEQPQAEHSEEPKKALLAEVGQQQTSPPSNRGGDSGGKQHPPENVPPRKSWCRRLNLTDWITAISALISAIATVIIMVWAGLQWREMDHAGRQTDRLICLY